MLTGGLIIKEYERGPGPFRDVVLIEPPYSGFDITTPMDDRVQNYEGEAFVYLSGGDSREADPFDGRRPVQSPGQTAVWRVPITKGLRAVRSQQLSFWSGRNNAKMVVTFIGGDQNGHTLVVGSSRNNNSFGTVGAVQESTGSSVFPGAELVCQGCQRLNNTTESYSDGTSYPPDDYTTYGDPQMVFNVLGDQLIVRNSQNNGGIVFRDVIYGQSGKTARSGTNFTHYPAVIIIQFTSRAF